MQLANGLVSFDFDPATGSLVQIRDLRSGIAYLSDPREGRLFRLFVPDPEEWIDRYVDSHEAGRPEMGLEGTTLVIRWRNLSIGTGRLDGRTGSGIGATVRVSLAAGDDEARFTLELVHDGLHTICEAHFPWVGGWQGFSGNRGTIAAGTHKPLDPFHDLRRNDGWNLLGYTRRVNIGFPHLNIPLCEVGNGSTGLSYNFYPEAVDLNYDLLVSDLNERLGDPHPSFSWVHRPFLAPGGRWKSGTVGIAPHQGDWHEAADRMRRWLATWWQPPRTPESLRGIFAFQNVYFRDFTGREHRPLSALPSLARHGLEHGVGHFIVWDMPMLGMYLRPGSAGLFEDESERIAELRRSLAEVRAMGVHVSPLVNLRLGTQTHPFWKEHGDAWAIRTRYGMVAPETLPLRAHAANMIVRYLDQGGARFCPHDPGFQEWAIASTGKVLDLGFDAAFLDQPFGEDYCFSDRHGHPVPAAGHAGACSWVARAAELVRSRSPGGYVIGEVPDIWNTQLLDLWWFWDWSWLRPEVFRYTLPGSLQSWVIDAYDHEDQVPRAFAGGFVFNLNVRSLERTLPDVPEFAARVKRLADLRAATRSFTVDGRFVDRRGLSIEAGDDAVAAVYEAGERVGVVLGDCDRARVSLDARVLGERKVSGVRLYREDGSVREPRWRRSGSGIRLETEVGRQQSAVLEVLLG
jgi:hypothetical protein